LVSSRVRLLSRPPCFSFLSLPVMPFFVFPLHAFPFCPFCRRTRSFEFACITHTPQIRGKFCFLITPTHTHTHIQLNTRTYAHTHSTQTAVSTTLCGFIPLNPQLRVDSYRDSSCFWCVSRYVLCFACVFGICCVCVCVYVCSASLPSCRHEAQVWIDHALQDLLKGYEAILKQVM
jgi:hypothetical protein